MADNRYNVICLYFATNKISLFYVVLWSHNRKAVQVTSPAKTADCVVKEFCVQLSEGVHLIVITVPNYNKGF
jgi:hypothetical protein